MTLTNLNKVYGYEKVAEVLAMQGAGWSTAEDTVDDIINDFPEISREEAEELMEILAEVEAIDEEED